MVKLNEKISVTVKFFADLREFGPKKVLLNLRKGSNIQSILEKYKIPSIKTNIIILVNGLPHKKADYEVKDGDIISIFPPIAGG